MINLSKKHYISQGKLQECYLHPENEKLCIKIRKDVSHEDVRVEREIKYYKMIQKKKDFSINFFAKYHGQINTNLGTGNLFDLIRDETTNAVSSTLYDYLKIESSQDDQIFKEILRIKEEMIKHKIIVRDMKAKNICCKIRRDNSLELIVIDGIGHRNFIPFVNWFKFAAKRKVNNIFTRRKLNSMEEQRNNLESLNPSSKNTSQRLYEK